MQTATSQQNMLRLGTSEGIYYLRPDEIIRLQASSNYTNIYFSNKKMMVSSRVLKDFVQLLSPFGFIRTHRTHLVNRQHILCIAPGGTIIMKDASVAGISRRMRSRVLKTLNKAA